MGRFVLVVSFESERDLLHVLYSTYVSLRLPHRMYRL